MMQAVLGSGHLPRGNLALHVGIASGDPQIVSALVKAYLKSPNALGQTALDMASCEGLEAVRDYLEKLQTIDLCGPCEPPVQILPSTQATSVQSQRSSVFVGTGLYQRVQASARGPEPQVLSNTARAGLSL